MSEQFTEIFRNYNQIRNKFFNKLTVPKLAAYEHYGWVHFISISSTIIGICAIYGQIRKMTLFSMHPTCMIIGVCIFLAEGIIVYRNKCLTDAVAPIMQHSTRMKGQVIHQTFQMIGGGFIFCGLVFIALNKVLIAHKSLIPMTPHSILGTLTVVAIVIQIISGNQKIDQIRKNNTKILRWHGELGLLTWDMLCATVLLGQLEFLNWSSLGILSELMLVILWGIVHRQARKKVTELPSQDESASVKSAESIGLLVDSGDEGDDLKGHTNTAMI